MSLPLRTYTDKTVKLWKISERFRRYSNLNTVTDEGVKRDEDAITKLRVPIKVQDDVSIEAMPRRIFSNAHTYHINSISVNSDDCTYLSADDLRLNLWDLERTDQSFSILPWVAITWLVVMGLQGSSSLGGIVQNKEEGGAIFWGEVGGIPLLHPLMKPWVMYKIAQKLVVVCWSQGKG